MFVWFDSLCSGQHFCCHTGTGLPGHGLNQAYLAEDKVSCSRTQCSASGEAGTSNPCLWVKHSTEPLKFWGISLFFVENTNTSSIKKVNILKVAPITINCSSFPSLQKILKKKKIHNCRSPLLPHSNHNDIGPPYTGMWWQGHINTTVVDHLTN